MQNKENEGVLIYKEHEVNGQKYTPKMCNIYYIDKELGEASITTRTDKISFSDNFLKNNARFFSNENIINIEGLNIVEPGDLYKVTNHLSCVASLVNMTDFTELPCGQNNIDTVGEYRDFIESLIILLQAAKKETEKQWLYLENTDDLSPNNDNNPA